MVIIDGNPDFPTSLQEIGREIDNTIDRLAGSLNISVNVQGRFYSRPSDVLLEMTESFNKLV